MTKKLGRKKMKTKKEETWPTCNQGKAWTDKDIEIVLSSLPTLANCRKYGRLLGRTVKAVMRVYQVAYASPADLKRKGKWANMFVRRISAVSHKMGIIKAWNPSQNGKSSKTEEKIA